MNIYINGGLYGVQRWKIMGIYYDILNYDGTTFTWKPNTPNDTTWKDTQGNLLGKMWVFAEFWYNKLTDSIRTGSRLLDLIEMDISRFIYNPEWKEGINVDFDDISINDINNIKTYTLYCFNAKFLPFLKSKIISEGVSI